MLEAVLPGVRQGATADRLCVLAELLSLPRRIAKIDQRNVNHWVYISKCTQEIGSGQHRIEGPSSMIVGGITDYPIFLRDPRSGIPHKQVPHTDVPYKIHQRDTIS